MEYQALARKYRPRNFTSLMGQDHVSKALGNALRTGRLHHAYLFSGTRGVGKTTIARILAKSLNCETGVVAEPCGECATCKEIDEGRFIDLIEVDAASKTKVEDTREMLENVQYAPVRGRFKIYLIDEVHMLSGHSFNALLKTLEEPPEHVKFLLATTDPQKLPITVLSRCLQFNLRHLSQQQIVQQLAKILAQEKITFEAAALEPIALSADGSMRDALSLLDQSIAYSNGDISLDNVDNMLGNVPTKHISNLLEALVENNAEKIMHTLEQVLALGMGVDNVLIELINVLQKMAMLKMLPNRATGTQNSAFDQKLATLCETISDEDIQLYYQIALSGRTDLNLSPFPQAALEMILLRMLAFRPVEIDIKKKTFKKPIKKTTTQSATGAAADTVSNTTFATTELEAATVTPATTVTTPVATTPLETTALGTTTLETTTKTPFKTVVKEEKLSQDSLEQQISKKKNITDPHHIVKTQLDLDTLWNECAYKVECSGIEKEILLYCSLLEKKQTESQFFIKLALDNKHKELLDSRIANRIKDKLQIFYKQTCASQIELKTFQDTEFKFEIVVQAQENEDFSQTPRQIEEKQKILQLQQAEKSIADDQNVQLLIEQFSAKIIPNTITSLLEVKNTITEEKI